MKNERPDYNISTSSFLPEICTPLPLAFFETPHVVFKEQTPFPCCLFFYTVFYLVLLLCKLYEIVIQVQVHYRHLLLLGILVNLNHCTGLPQIVEILFYWCVLQKFPGNKQTIAYLTNLRKKICP